MRPPLLGWPLLVASVCIATVITPASPLPRSSPEAQGISSAAILDFIDAADREIDAMNSFILVRHGHVVAEGWWKPYAAELPHTLFSLSKSFTSTAVGLAVADGKLSVDDEVLKFFPGDAPAQPSEHLRQMRVRDLLSMSTGHHAEDLQNFPFQGPGRLTRAFLALPVAHKPGTLFVYNTPATFMLSAIVQKVTGETLMSYLQPRLFEPLGIEHPVSATSAQGIDLGGYGMAMTTEDIARFGQLYLQKGAWQGRQLLPSTWVEAATARQTSNGSNPSSDWDQGYGYQFWRCRYGLYRGDGAFGQYCIVMPEQDAIVAITSGVRDMQAVMNLVWTRLLPAMQTNALPPDRPGHEKLMRKLSTLSLPTPAGAKSSPLAAQVAGKTFVLPSNSEGIDSLRFEFASDVVILALSWDGIEHRIACAYGTWRPGRTALFPTLANDPLRQPEQSIAAAGAWASPETFTAKVCLNETPYILTLSFRFEGSEVFFDLKQNVAFGPSERPQLIGKAL
jgi:CubicO group peptidase (beta-lactamase class C family)